MITPGAPAVPLQRAPAAAAPAVRDRVPALLAATALAVVATHWLRLLPLPDTAGPSATRLEDFADLLTPFLVLGPLLVALAALRPGRRTWAAVLVGSVLFVQGHGLHLSANSVAWAQRGQGLQEPTHLWDEVVGHHLWFVGLTVVVVGAGAGARGGAAAGRPGRRAVRAARPDLGGERRRGRGGARRGGAGGGAGRAGLAVPRDARRPAGRAAPSRSACC